MVKKQLDYNFQWTVPYQCQKLILKTQMESLACGSWFHRNVYEHFDVTSMRV